MSPVCKQAPNSKEFLLLMVWNMPPSFNEPRYVKYLIAHIYIAVLYTG